MNVITAEQALVFIPEHTMVAPGQELLAGDEWFTVAAGFVRCDSAEPLEIGTPLTLEGKPLLVQGDDIVRRPIPKAVRELMAQRVYYYSSANVSGASLDKVLWPIESWIFEGYKKAAELTEAVKA